MSTNTSTTNSTTLHTEAAAQIAENPFCGYAIFNFLTQDNLRAKIDKIIEESIAEIYKPGKWEKDFHQADRILNLGVVDEYAMYVKENEENDDEENDDEEDDDEEDDDEVDVESYDHYGTLYDYVESYPGSAAWTIVDRLEKLGCNWLYIPDGDDLFHAFGQIDDQGKRTGEFYGETMATDNAQRNDWIECSYDLRTPEFLVNDWKTAFNAIIRDLWERADDPDDLWEDDEEDIESSNNLSTIQLGRTTDGEPIVQKLVVTPHMITVAPEATNRSMFLRHLITQIRQSGFRLVIVSPELNDPSLHEFASVTDTGVQNSILALVKLALELKQSDDVFSPENPTIVLIEDTGFFSNENDAESTQAAHTAMRMLIEYGAEKGIYTHTIHSIGDIDEELFGPGVAKNILTGNFGASQNPALPKKWDAENYADLTVNTPDLAANYGVTDLGGDLQCFQFPYIEPAQWVQGMRDAGF